MVRRVWRYMVRNAPRQLRFTRAGRVVVGLALAVGFAAINTGNNLLFLAWGLILSGIVVSGVLSELVLRGLVVEAVLPRDARAGQALVVPVKLANTAKRFAALGLEVRVTLTGPSGKVSTAIAPFVLRLSGGANLEALARVQLDERGKHTIDEVTVETMYPFGFFAKSRPYKRTPAPAFWVAPAVVDVSETDVSLMSRRGLSASMRPGAGEDYFAMRAFREGDDPKRIKWRRSARSGRLLLAENEAMAGREVIIEVIVGRRARRPDVERAIATAGSLAERFLADGVRVGLRGPGTTVASSTVPGHAWTILRGLAAMDHEQPAEGGMVTRGTMLVAVCAGDVNTIADFTVRIGGSERAA